MLRRSPWRTPRRRWTASLPAAVAAAALSLTLAVGSAPPALAAPSDQPGGTSGVLDSSALDELQQRAAEAQEGLKQRQEEIARAREDLDAAQAQVDAAQEVLDETEGVLAERQAVVAQYAAAAYRDGGTLTPLTVLLTGNDPGDMVAALGYLEAVDRHTADVLAEAEAQRQVALDDQDRARNALAQAQERADEVQRQIDELEAQAAAVTEELDRALGVVDSQLAQLQEEQVRVNEQTAANWQAYLDQLAVAGVVPPPASEF